MPAPCAFAAGIRLPESLENGIPPPIATPIAPKPVPLKKLRRLEITAGAPRWQGRPGVWGANKAVQRAERELARQAEAAYRRTVADWRTTGPQKVGASAKYACGVPTAIFNGFCSGTSRFATQPAPWCGGMEPG